jgi:AbrB family looped-hinge helix DNA binding protein
MPKVATSTVTSKGQVTVPEKVRRALAVGQGDRLEWVTGSDGRVEVRKAGGDLRRLVGMLGKPRRSATVEEMDAALKARHREHHARR